MFPKDADVAAFSAEAQVDVHPWDCWNADGTPRPWTPEILAAPDFAAALPGRAPCATRRGP